MATNNTNPPPQGPPATMKACVATGFGEVDENIFLRNNIPTPKLEEQETDSMIIQVLSCALAPGDVRILSGKTAYVQLPKTGHPYIPGSDCSGIVVAVSSTESKFQVGDYVVSRFETPRPIGGLAEYRKVKTRLSEKCPVSITPEQACGLLASAMSAKQMVRDYVQKESRVLVIGASGGVGTSVLQYAKLAGVSFLAAVSTQTSLCEQLGADQVIDYREKKWWEMPEFQTDPFDVVIDMVNGDNWTVGGCSGKAVKSSGVYVALMTGVKTELEVNSMWGIVKISWQWLATMVYARLHPKLPRLVFPETLDAVKENDFRELLEDVDARRLEPILDPASPFAFTESGVRQAFALQKSIHAHGKVVVQISNRK